jgi:exosortase/archaeosortase family protein
MSLFVVIFCALWWLLSKRGGVYHGRAVLALVAGVAMFYCINILRIVLIMIIGSFSRVIGMVLFHGTAGSLFFFLVIVVVIRFVMPLLRRESHDTVRR